MTAPIRFETAGASERIGWVRRGAYLIRHKSGKWEACFMPRMSAKHPRPTFTKLATLDTERDAIAFTQADNVTHSKGGKS